MVVVVAALVLDGSDGSEAAAVAAAAAGRFDEGGIVAVSVLIRLPNNILLIDVFDAVVVLIWRYGWIREAQKPAHVVRSAVFSFRHVMVLPSSGPAHSQLGGTRRESVSP